MSKVVIATCTAILLLGLLAAWDMLDQLTTGRIHLNLFVLFIPIGIGLFLGRPWARTAAVWMFRLTYLLSAALLIAAWFVKPVVLRFGEEIAGLHGFPVALVLTAILCSVTGFLHWLLYLPQFEDHLDGSGSGRKQGLR